MVVPCGKFTNTHPDRASFTPFFCKYIYINSLQCPVRVYSKSLSPSDVVPKTGYNLNSCPIPFAQLFVQYSD
jgi:hypothetical protein